MTDDFVARYVTLADPLAAYDTVVAAVGNLLRRTSLDQYAAPTPCDDWTVHKVMDHLVEVVEMYGELAHGVMPQEGEERRYDDPAAAFPAIAAKARESFAAPGFLETVASTPIGPQPGKVVVQHVVNELVTHGWDLARGTGQDSDLVPPIAEAVLDSWQAFLGSGVDRVDLVNFEAERSAPSGATPADRVAAYLGRTV